MKTAVDKIIETGNIYGEKSDRKAWAKDVKVAAKADTLYYVGDNTSYKNPQIAQATATILNKLGIDFMLLDDEKNDGNVVFSIGMVDLGKKDRKGKHRSHQGYRCEARSRIRCGSIQSNEG